MKQKIPLFKLSMAGLLIFSVFGCMMSVATKNDPQKSYSQASHTNEEVNPKAKYLDGITVTPKLYKAGFGNVFEGDIQIKNDNDIKVKDITILCTLYAPSGTVIGTPMETIYETVPPHKTRKFSDVNFGFINKQTDRYDCNPVDVKIDQ